MEGSITQLGLSNYLINDKSPKVSYFKHSYFNYSNFAFDTRKLNFFGISRFGGTNSFRIDQNLYGDLITNIILEVDLPDISNILTNTGHNIGYCNGVGNVLLENVELKINGEIIDTQNSVWRDIWGELTIDRSQQNNYYSMIKKFPNFNVLSFQGGKVYIPLMFWFCQYHNRKDPSLVFPLAAFYNQTIELNVKFAPFLNLVVSNDNSTPLTSAEITNSQLLIDYVTLEEHERVALQSSRNYHNYLMAQTTYLNFDFEAGITQTVIPLRQLKYLISELIIVVRLAEASSPPVNDYFNYSTSLILTSGTSPIKRVSMRLDGRDKYRDVPAQFFYQAVPLKCHTNINDDSYIHCMSFSLYPEKLEQPSGLCNFSEIQEPVLILEFQDNLPAFNVLIYAINYNMAELKDGCFSLLHSMSKSVPSKLQSIGKIMQQSSDITKITKISS